MMTRMLILMCIAWFGTMAVNAQEPAPADDWKPSITNQKGKEYPQVNSERPLDSE